jgi:predicted outer membrane repeat protein
MKKVTFLFVFLVSIIAIGQAEIINIPADYNTIQEGIDASSDGDTVLVQPGTYIENINFNGHNITLASRFLTTRDTTFIHSTIIDGNADGSVITCENGEDRNTIIIGFTITNGYAISGGGIECVEASPAIAWNLIQGNDGVGIYCWGGSPIIDRNVIKRNISGSGISVLHSRSMITNNLICYNENGWGGGISCYQGGIYIINNTITHNAASHGGGIEMVENSPILINNIIWADTLGSSNYEIHNYNAWPTITYCNIQGELIQGEGNTNVDPLFRDPENEDFHLMATYCGDPYDSPCIDAGNPWARDSLIDCDFGLGEGRSDMGAFGGFTDVVFGDVSGIWTADESPYNVIEDIYVDSILTIEPGVTVRFCGSFGIETWSPARFVAIGTAEDSIYFTPTDTSIGWSGLYFNRVDSTSELQYCHFEHGKAVGPGDLHERGGAISCFRSYLKINNCTFIDNWALQRGGAIDLWESFPEICQCAFLRNSSEDGGAVYCYRSIPKLYNDVFCYNSADNYGGAIYTLESVSISNCVISYNNAYSGGGIYAGDRGLIRNTILRANSAPENPHIFGSVTVNYCNIQDSIWPGIGNIDVDPLFRDPQNDDFHLMATYCGDPYDSPCIDAGDPNVFDSLLDCAWGLGTASSDMGAYGGGDSTMVGIPDEKVTTPSEYHLSQNYPNPFNSATTITYALPENAHVRLEIYNLLGQRTEVLVDSDQRPGEYAVTWNSTGFASGIYFCKLTAGDKVFTKRMVLIK